MPGKTSVKPILISILTFIILEGAALWMMSGSSYFQRARLNEAYIQVEKKLLNSNSNIRYYLTLNRANAVLAEENSQLRNALSKYQALSFVECL